MTLQNQNASATTDAPSLEVTPSHHNQADYTSAGDLLQAALAYASRGWPVFPCREKPGKPYINKKGREEVPAEKSPYVKNGFHKATTDPAQIRAWWNRWPNAIIGISCGPAGLFVFDLDTKDGKDGPGNFEKLGYSHEGALHSRTPSKGLHIIFSGTGKTKTNQDGIDTRGKGGYIIAPPSKILEGKYPGEYTALDDWTRDPAPLPAGLVEALEAMRGKAPAKSKPAPTKTRPAITPKTDEVEKARQALARLAPWRCDDYSAWCDVGFSLSELGAAGLALWDEWSKNSPKYQPGACEEKWDTFTPGAGLTLASLHYWAKEDDPGGEPVKIVTVYEPEEPEAPPMDDKLTQAELPQMPEAVRTRYQIIDGSFYAMDYDRDGSPKPKYLANWHGKIIREVARDDGQDVTRRFVITGQLATGQRLPTCEIDAASFASMNWVIQQWGLRANMAAGQSIKDKLREAIQLESQEAEISTVYTHTGWREIEGKRVYLTTSGALGMDGITVDLDGNLKRYALPQDLAKVNRQEAIRASLRFLEVAPKSVTFPLWGSMYLAPLAEISPFDFVMWVYGETGSMKSTLSALALCHYGEFDYKHLPEGWVSTDNILEKQTFVIKDAPLVIDDFAPQATAIDGQTYQRRAERLIRAIGDHIPRTRMNADTSTRTGFTARGLVISTAEQLPSGQSIVGRLLPVEVFPKSVDTDKLTTAQNKDAALYPYALANYLCWLAANWQDLKSNYREWHREQRDSVRSLLKGDYHARTPEMFAHVLMGLRLALTYATEEKVITEKEAASMLTQAKKELITLAQAQGEHVKDELPAIKFIHAIKAMIAKGDYYIEGATISYPDNAKWLGWADKEFYYLQSEVTYNAATEFVRKEGASIGLPQKSLNSQLVQKGYIMKGDRNVYSAWHKEKGSVRTYAFYRHRFDE